MTTYGQLLDIATQNLATATVRARHPATRPNATIEHALTDTARALAHLGTVLGLDRTEHRTLSARLRTMSRVDCEAASADRRPTGVELDLVDAASALRTAADLIASTGPLPGNLTPRLLDHSDWTRPRPEDLHSPPALAAGWAQLADLTLISADLATTTGHPALVAAADRAARAALLVPRPSSQHMPLQAVTPGWPLPLPRQAVPNEWAGRLTELSAIAWRLTRAPRPGDGHPIGALRAIAEIGYHVHQRAAGVSGNPPALASALRDRAHTWSRIHACTAALHAAPAFFPADQRWSLLRTRELAAVGELDPADLLAGRSTLAVVATYGSAVAGHLADRPGVQLGPHIPRELRVTPDIALAALHRQAIPVPPSAGAALATMFRTAAQPVAAGAEGTWVRRSLAKPFAPPMSTSLRGSRDAGAFPAPTR